MADKTTKKRYVLTTATAALLAAGAITTATLTLRAGVPQTQVKRACVPVAKSTMAGMTGAQMAGQGCNLVDQRLELSGGDVCTIDDLLKIEIFLNDDDLSEEQANVCVTASIDGEWGPGSAE